MAAAAPPYCCCCGFGSQKPIPSRHPNTNTTFTFRFRPPAIARSFSVSTTATTVEPAEDPAGIRPRRLILLRHAESIFGDRFTRGRDHDRPLSKVGKTDAIKIAHKLEQLDWIPELILCSDAVRTKETVEILRENTDRLKEAELQFVPSFYSVAAMDGQTAQHLQKAICQFSTDQIFTIMCMGHNRGWEEAASMLCGNTVELKTCNAALLESSGKSWTEAFSSAGLGGWKLHGILKP